MYYIKESEIVFFIDSKTGEWVKGEAYFKFGHNSDSVTVEYGFWKKNIELQRWEVFTLTDIKIIQEQRINVGPFAYNSSDFGKK